MAPEIELVDVKERIIAAATARIAMADIPEKIFPLMDRVWASIRSAGIEGTGHNIWVYGLPSDGEVDVEIGVQVPAPFKASGDIVCSRTPAGKAARAVHLGDYADLPRVHVALLSWCQDHGHKLAGSTWEIYGDWAEDPAKQSTDVYRLIG